MWLSNCLWGCPGCRRGLSSYCPTPVLWLLVGRDCWPRSAWFWYFARLSMFIVCKPPRRWFSLTLYSPCTIWGTGCNLFVRLLLSTRFYTSPRSFGSAVSRSGSSGCSRMRVSWETSWLTPLPDRLRGSLLWCSVVFRGAWKVPVLCEHNYLELILRLPWCAICYLLCFFCDFAIIKGDMFICWNFNVWWSGYLLVPARSYKQEEDEEEVDWKDRSRDTVLTRLRS